MRHMDECYRSLPTIHGWCDVWDDGTQGKCRRRLYTFERYQEYRIRSLDKDVSRPIGDYCRRIYSEHEVHP